MSETVNYLFRAKTKENDAFVVKILSELLSNVVKWAPFTVNEKGISLNQRDERNEQWLEILLNKDDFHIFINLLKKYKLDVEQVNYDKDEEYENNLNWIIVYIK